MKSKKRLRLAGLFSVFLALASCGGESSSPKLSTGYFVDSGVQGLYYYSGTTTNGTTGPGGAFNYTPGSSVQFFLYGQPLIQSPLYSQISSAIVTPFHLNISEYHPAYPLNVMRFLLALDTDQVPNNGITLPAHNGSFLVNFNVSLQAFEADTYVKAFLAAYAKGRPLHPLKDTVEHFSNTISTIARSQGYATYFLEFGPPALRQTSTAAVYTSVATSDIRNSNCDNVAGGWAYTFGQDSFEMKGKDEFINNGSGNGICTLGPITTLSYQYPTPAQKTNEFLGCLPKCAYDEINRISWIAKDEDGRTVIEYSWHTPGTQIISYVKLIVEDLKNNNHPAALSYFYEIITLK